MRPHAERAPSGLPWRCVLRLSRTLAAAVVPLALAAAPFIPAAGASDEATETEAARAPNVLVKITLGKVEAGQLKPLRSYQMMASGSGRPARMSTTNRIPLPTVTMGPDDKRPVTSYTYQNVGFQATVRATVDPRGDAVRINADIEDTALYNPEAVHTLDSGDTKVAPVVTSFTQSIEALLRRDAPALTTLVDDPKGQSMYIQVGAEIQR
jgi:hypothetical protein